MGLFRIPLPAGVARALVLAFAAVAVGCGGSNDSSRRGGGSGGAGGGGTTDGSTGSGDPAPDCGTRCFAKATDCGAPTSTASEVCDQVCGLGLTDTQVSCLEASTCDELAAAFNGGDAICGIGSGSGTTTSGGSTTASSGSGTTYLELGDACTCGGGADLCQSTRGPCEPDLTCVLGECAGPPCDASTVCPAGADCTIFVKDGVELGAWCAPPPP